MTYLNSLDTELKAAGITGRRRQRILAEFADHLHEDPSAQLGAPRDLALQFADELGTRLARTAAFRAFAALAFAGISFVAMFVAAGGMRSMTGYGTRHDPTPSWVTPIFLISALAAQVAFVAGTLALLRAWRLRHERVIGREDAIVLARRSTVGLVCGALTMALLPAVAVAFPHYTVGSWTLIAWIVEGVAVVALLSVAPTVLRSARLRPVSSGEPADLIADLGPWLPRQLTPARCAVLLATAIFVLMGFQGLVVDDPYDGLLRGIADGTACLAGFAVLGRYLGLRSTAR